jgi:hypothetical protein
MQTTAGDLEEEEEEEDGGLVHGRRRRRVQFMPSVGESCHLAFPAEARSANRFARHHAHDLLPWALAQGKSLARLPSTQVSCY